MYLFGPFRGGTATEPNGSGKRQVVVAQRNIQQGAVLSADMIQVKTIPASAAGPFDLTNPAAVVGQVTTTELSQGQRLRTEDVESPAVAGLPYQIAQGMRAMTIAVSDTTGVDGRLLPGDLVEALLVTGSQGVSQSSILVHQAKVLAVGPPSAATAQSNMGTGTVSNYTSVTLQVSPSQATRLGAGEAEGSVILLLRPLPSTPQGNP